MKISKIIISIIVTILIFLVMYLLFSFIAWDFNPQKWSENDSGSVRALYVFLSLVLSAYFNFIYFE